MPAAKPPRRPAEIAVTMRLGDARQTVYIRADRNAPAAFRAFTEGFHKEHFHELIGAAAEPRGDR